VQIQENRIFILFNNAYDMADNDTDNDTDMDTVDMGMDMVDMAV